jgi:hypothetical protein
VFTAGAIFGVVGFVGLALGAVLFFAGKAEWISWEPEIYESRSRLLAYIGILGCTIGGLMLLLGLVL